MRTIAFGDIHGCNKAVRALIEIIEPTADDTLVFLGDYIDRGPDSRGTLDYLLELEAQYRTVFLRGNHEIMFSGCTMHGMDPTLWYQMGGRTTLVSYGGHLDAVPANHRDFVRRCLPHYENESHFFVHANYLAELPMDQQPESSLYWEHLHERMPVPHCSGKTAWLGHSPQMQGHIADWGYLLCIDTFCFGGMYLTAIDVDSREIWQADKWGNLRGHRSPVLKFGKWLWRRWQQQRLKRHGGQNPQSPPG